MKEISIENFDENAVKMISKDWLLLTAGNDLKANTMTASWGGIGFLWNKNVLFLFVRPQRYTKEFIDNNERLSVSVLPNTFKEQLGYLGKVSGRDDDKIKKSNLTLMEYDGVPCFDEARLTFICKKLYAQSLEENCFIDESILIKSYTEKDYHTMYVVEIEKILQK